MDDLLSLAEAADELGLSPVTLRAARDRGRIAAKLFGNTYVTTRHEVDRYRRENLGQGGRPQSEWRRASQSTGWQVFYTLVGPLAADRGRALSAQGTVAFAVDHGKDEEEIITRLVEEAAMQSLEIRIVTVDRERKAIRAAVFDLRPNPRLGSSGAIRVGRPKSRTSSDIGEATD